MIFVSKKAVKIAYNINFGCFNVSLFFRFHNIKSNSKNLIVKFVCSVEMSAQYEMKGQLLVPVEGMGKTSAVISKF